MVHDLIQLRACDKRKRQGGNKGTRAAASKEVEKFFTERSPITLSLYFGKNGKILLRGMESRANKNLLKTAETPEKTRNIRAKSRGDSARKTTEWEIKEG